jgi:hypothetical protein
MQQVYGYRGSKDQGRVILSKCQLWYSIFLFVFTKRGRKFCSSLHTFGFAKQQKGEIVTLNNFFDFVILQNVIEFNKFFFKI